VRASREILGLAMKFATTLVLVCCLVAVIDVSIIIPN